MKKGGVSSEFLDILRSKSDIIDVASKYITLNRRGSNFWACCPFHMEKTPSFSIKQDGQFFKCFGCGESGNVITFVMKMENVDFMTAVEILAKNAGLELPSDQDNEEMKKKKLERDKCYQILRKTTEFYHENLLNNPNSPQAQYLKSRGLNQQSIEKFKIGASLDYDALPKHLLKAGFKIEDMITAGVVGRGDKGEIYDFYGNRLMFPISNGFGDVVAFSGRSVEANPTRTKYKNTPQSPIFNKSDILFGYHFVRDLKKEHMLDTIIIVEGHLDVITCHQYGIDNTIGCMGTALTTLHANKIKRLVDNVILCLDGDSAGASATYKAIDILREVGLNVKVVRLKDAKDPDEYLKKFGKDNFLECLTNAVDCVDFILHDRASKYDLTTNSSRNSYIQEALDYISKFSTPAEQEIYLAVVQKLTHVSMDALKRSIKNNNEIKIVDKETLAEPVQNNYIIESKIMLLSSILYKKITNFDEIKGLFVSRDELSELYEFLVSKIKEEKDYNVSTLFDNFEITPNSLIDRVINYKFPSDEVFETFLTETIKRVKLTELQDERDKLKEKLMSSNDDNEKYSILARMKEITDLINKEKK
ncbi:MAG: DNA primase [Clostridiales bacterium]|nr:DNA primase [Clostridiales bacterium]